MKLNYTLFILLFISCLTVRAQNTISGTVTDVTLSPQSGARITLFNSDTTFFREERTNISGNFIFSNVPNSTLRLGIALREMEYKDTLLIVNSSLTNLNFFVANETHQGQWNIIMQSPERLGGTDLGVLMPNGKVFYCHDTEDPFYFDPAVNDTDAVNGSNAIQGCVGPILTVDSTLWFFGGTLQAIYGPGTKKVKTFNALSQNWQFRTDMLGARWYPTVSPLSTGNVLILGGGGVNNPVRVKTSEVYDPITAISTVTDTIALGNEVSPILPLLNGKTLMTHRPPQLFDPATNQWDLAGDFVQGNRMSNGDHSDHELILMPDGNVFAFGYKPFNNPLGTFVEMYNPVTNQWSLKSNYAPVRSRAKAILLPDKKIIVAGGEKEDSNNNSPVNQWNYMKRTDLYNPATDSWRHLNNLNYFREYHCIITLVPDGRLIAVGGEGQPGNEPAQSIIEAFKPPYLFRGVRPEMVNLSSTTFQRGDQFIFNALKTDSITSLHLMSNAVNTHFMNSSSNRFIELEFTNNNGFYTATLPTDSLILYPGFYMLFAMVDDIPSVAKIIRVLNSTNSIPTVIDEQETGLIIYPNPVNESLSIYSDSPVIKANLYDLTGKQIFNEQSSEIKTIDFENFADGFYFLFLEFNNGKSQFRKILKQKN